MNKTYKIRVTGRVQGVGFRFTCYLAFTDLGLKGSAENMKDGSLYIEATGEEAQLERLLKWVYRGPEGARVQDVQVTKEEAAEDDKNDYSDGDDRN